MTRTVLALLTILTLAACGGGGGDSSDNVIVPQSTCRNYASSYMTDSGVNVSCTFDRSAIILRDIVRFSHSCISDRGELWVRHYPSVKRFIEEVEAVGKRTLAQLEHKQPIVGGYQSVTYDYDEQGRLISSQSMGPMLDDGVAVLFTDYDDLGRPSKGSTSPSRSYPNDLYSGITLVYDDVKRQVRVIFHGTGIPPYSEERVNTFDENGNLIETIDFTSDGAISAIQRNTITSIDTVCDTD